MHVSYAIKRLNEAYHSGVIAYPRVNNDYIKNSAFQFFAHPGLKKGFDAYANALAFDEYPFNKDTALLWLNQIDLALPSKFDSVFSFLDKYFDYEMKPRDEKALRQKINEYAKFLLNEGIELSKTMKSKKNPHSSRYYYTPYLQGFKIKLEPSLKKKRDENKKRVTRSILKTGDRLKERTDSRAFASLVSFDQVSRYDEALAIVAKKRKMLMRSKMMASAVYAEKNIQGECD